MINLLRDNAFGILGLLPDTSQKEISRRGKEILKLIKIGESPVYQFDLGLYGKKRTEENVSNALNNLASIKTHIQHSFFRIMPISKEENSAICSFQGKKDLNDKICFVIENKDIRDRNKLIILLILLYLDPAKRISKSVVNKIQTILDNFTSKEVMMNDFEKIYRLSDEIGVNDTVFSSFKEEIGKQLLYICSDISCKQKDNRLFYMALSYLLPYVNNANEIPLLKEFFENLTRNFASIENLTTQSVNDKKNLKMLLIQAENLFNESVNMHLYDSSLFLEYKDKFCEILMDKSVDYYNTTMDLDVALGFLEVVQKIEGSPSIMRRLQESKNTLFRIKKEETEPLIKLYLEKNKEYPEFCFYRNELVVTQKKFFTGKHLDTILYKNVEGYSFSIVRETTNFITHVYHVLTIVTSDKNYCYNYTSGGWNDTTKTDFCGILGVWEKLVADILVDKILYVIFDLNERYKIGSLILDNQGIREKGFFRDSILRWEDMKYEPTIASGSVCIFTEKNKTFTILSLSEINAPIIPLLFKKIISEELYRVTI